MIILYLLNECRENMKSGKYHRRSIRLRGYDYTQTGLYFVTVCTQNKECLLGEIKNGIINSTRFGSIVQYAWYNITKYFQCVTLDEFCLMPNHIHGIIIVNDFAESDCRGEVTSPLLRPTLGQIIAYFKYQSTKNINIIRNSPGVKFWQRNYYEHIVRNNHELRSLYEYIMNNPIKWTIDKENPKARNTVLL